MEMLSCFCLVCSPLEPSIFKVSFPFIFFIDPFSFMAVFNGSALVKQAAAQGKP